MADAAALVGGLIGKLPKYVAVGIQGRDGLTRGFIQQTLRHAGGAWRFTEKPGTLGEIGGRAYENLVAPRIAISILGLWGQVGDLDITTLPGMQELARRLNVPVRMVVHSVSDHGDIVEPFDQVFEPTSAKKK
jgi:hypothetical protein